MSGQGRIVAHREDCSALTLNATRADVYYSSEADPCACSAAADLRELVEAAGLKRNTIIHDDPRFIGEWVAVPIEDFDALVAALAPFRGAK